MRDPDRLTPELLDAVVAEVSRGVPAYRAAQARGIAKSTFYDWLRWGREGRAPYTALVERLEGAASKRQGCEPRWCGGKDCAVAVRADAQRLQLP